MDSKSQQKIISRHGPLISSKSSDKVSTKGTFSVEDSGPPSPHSGTVNNFGEVAPGIYRSSFPYPENIEHLKTLGLKTVLTLVDTEHSAEFNEYVKEEGIRHIRILVPAHKTPAVAIPIKTIIEIQKTMHDSTMHPMLIHCNKGKHRTGCMVATYRKLNDWKMPAIITEYRKFTGAKFRPLDEAYIASINANRLACLLGTYILTSEDEKYIAEYQSLTASQSTMLPTPPASEKSVGEGEIEVEGQDGKIDPWGIGQILIP